MYSRKAQKGDLQDGTDGLNCVDLIPLISNQKRSPVACIYQVKWRAAHVTDICAFKTEHPHFENKMHTI